MGTDAHLDGQRAATPVHTGFGHALCGQFNQFVCIDLRGGAPRGRSRSLPARHPLADSAYAPPAGGPMPNCVAISLLVRPCAANSIMRALHKLHTGQCAAHQFAQLRMPFCAQYNLGGNTHWIRSGWKDANRPIPELDTTLDMVFRDDKSRVRTASAPASFTTPKHIALKPLRRASDRLSIRGSPQGRRMG